jgi:glucans biosynthesis protein
VSWLRAFITTAAFLPPPLSDLTWDQYQAISFRLDQAVWAQEPCNFRLGFFHLGRGFSERVQMYEIVDGLAREISYQPRFFDFGQSGVDAKALRSDLGFAGFRIYNAMNWNQDVLSFLGASYFRGIGYDMRQFGLSARGLAIDTANDVEEFPRFVAWWFERPDKDSRTLALYGLLDSPSAAGAYRFAITPGASTVVDVDAAVYPRKAIRRLGIAPLTSMYQCGENDRRTAYDWRPEIHDSDGLAIWNGQGEWIWRPLSNPTAIHVNSFFDESRRGFGLLQRDRNFDHYQDDGVFYERRPSLWIEPKACWGKGAVQLVELPTTGETFDNIVAYWNPATLPEAGDELLYSYRMFWGTQLPMSSPLAQVTATRTGLGGIVGQKREHFSWRYAVDFCGGALSVLTNPTEVEPVIATSRGVVAIPSSHPLTEGSAKGYRAMFDLQPTDDSTDPIDIRILRYRNQSLTETWLYQWTPPPPRARKEFLVLAGDWTE